MLSTPATGRSTPAKRPGEAMPSQRPARSGRGGFNARQAFDKAAEDHNASSVGSKKRVPPGPPQGGKSVSTRVEEQQSKRTGGLANQSSVNIPRAPLSSSSLNAPTKRPISSCVTTFNCNQSATCQKANRRAASSSFGTACSTHTTITCSFCCLARRYVTYPPGDSCCSFQRISSCTAKCVIVLSAAVA
mmetsp:Transcript_102015/g.164423  ORF Transcript_102015/g.164423 Transcript_102015/m.164423 type:complete len:189 (-) Transcript_102015:76-642(-)